MMAIFKNKQYPELMFLLITILSIIILFSFVDFVQDIDKGFTAYAIQQQNITPTQSINATEKETGEIYTIQAWGIFYLIIIVVILLIAFLAIILKKTVQKEIKEEEEEREAI